MSVSPLISLLANPVLGIAYHHLASRFNILGSKGQIIAFATSAAIQIVSHKPQRHEDGTKFSRRRFRVVLPYLLVGGTALGQCVYFKSVRKADLVGVALLSTGQGGIGLIADLFKHVDLPKIGTDNEELRVKGQQIFIDFYSGSCANLRGVTIEQIWGYDSGQLEAHHDFIQWIFPNRKISGSLPSAPLITDDIQRTFQSSEELQKRLFCSLQLMLNHYGLECSKSDHYGLDLPPTYSIKRSDEFEKKKQNLLGHNRLRITRILNCLIDFGRVDLAKAFFFTLQEINEEKILGEAFTQSFNSFWEPLIRPHLDF